MLFLEKCSQKSTGRPCGSGEDDADWITLVINLLFLSVATARSLSSRPGVLLVDARISGPRPHCTVTGVEGRVVPSCMYTQQYMCMPT